MLIMCTKVSLLLVAAVICINVNLAWTRTLEQNFVLTKSEPEKTYDPAPRLRRDVILPEQSATIESFHVSSTVTSRYSRVLITSVVRNIASKSNEVAVELRLPKKAFISNFSMEIDHVTYVGVVKEKAAAKREYQQAVSRGESAGMVSTKTREEQSFSVSVNVAAGKTVTFQLHYQELLIRKLGLYHHIIYTDPGQIVKDLVVEVLISEPIGIDTIEVTPPAPQSSETKRENENVVVRRSNSQTYIKYEPSEAQQQALKNQDQSFVVTYNVTREEVGGEILIKNGYFVHFFAPSNMPVIKKTVVFVIDRSGSMMGNKMSQTKKAMMTILDDLNENDRFNIISFSRNTNIWRKGEVMSTNAVNIDDAKRFVNNIKASGSTNIFQATKDAVNLLKDASSNKQSTLEEAYMLILLTDGQPTAGITNTHEIRSKITQEIGGKYSLFCLGFGSGVDHNFLQKFAKANKGLSRRIYIDSDVALQLKGFHDEVASPLLAHVIMKYRGAPVTDLTTTSFDNFYDGSEILVAGRLHGSTPDFDLQGLIEARSAERDLILVSRGKELESTFDDDSFDMEKLWAYLTIKDLLKNKTNSDDEATITEINNEILRLSLRFNFVTPLTSMIVTKPNKDDETNPPIRPPTPMPFPGPIPSPIPVRRVQGMSLQSYALPRLHNMRINAGNRGSSGRQYSFAPALPQPMSQVFMDSNPGNNLYPSMFPSRNYISRMLNHQNTQRPKKRPNHHQNRHRGRISKKGRKSKSGRGHRHRHRKITTTTTTTTTTTPPTTTTTTPTPTPTTTTTNPMTTSLPIVSESTTLDQRILTRPPVIENNCGENIELSNSRNITSPQFPGLYAPNSHCVWNITRLAQNNTNENQTLRITFLSFDLEKGEGTCNRDKITVYSDLQPSDSVTSESQSFCGSDRDPNSIRTYFNAAHRLVVVFQSDDVVNGRGFLANLDVVSIQ